MQQNSQKLIFFLSKITCAFAMAIAVLSVNSTCCFTAYQPDVPESVSYTHLDVYKRQARHLPAQAWTFLRW